jgi:hypothetical protein
MSQKSFDAPGRSKGEQYRPSTARTCHRSGGRVLTNQYPNAHYVRPAIVEMPSRRALLRAHLL